MGWLDDIVKQQQEILNTKYDPVPFYRKQLDDIQHNSLIDYNKYPNQFGYTGKEIPLTQGRYNTGKVDTGFLDAVLLESKKTGVNPLDILAVAGRESTFKAYNSKRKDLNLMFSDWNGDNNKNPTYLEYFGSKKQPGTSYTVTPMGYNYSMVNPDKFYNSLTSKDIGEYEKWAGNIVRNRPENAIQDVALKIKNNQMDKYNPGDPDYQNKLANEKKLLGKETALNNYLKVPDIKFKYNTIGIPSPMTLEERVKDNLVHSKFKNGGTPPDSLYQAWRSKLPKNLQVESPDYNLRGAYEAGLQPKLQDDGTYHLDSRNPQTGEILKGENHPTFQHALDVDKQMGYEPVYKDGKWYTLPKPQVPQIFPNGFKPQFKQGGGVIQDNRGQWAHPGKVTQINSPNITMQGVNYPVLGVDNLGNQQMMMPNQNYKFKGNQVTEYPMLPKAQDGLNTNPETYIGVDFPDRSTGYMSPFYGAVGPTTTVNATKTPENLQIDNARAFTQGWMNSPMYKEMLQKSTNKKFSKTKYPLYNLKNSIFKKDYNYYATKRQENFDITKINRVDKSFYPPEDENTGGSSESKKFFDGQYHRNVYIRTDIPSSRMSVEDTTAHEFSHATDDNGRLIPRADTDMMGQYAKKGLKKGVKDYEKLEKQFQTAAGESGVYTLDQQEQLRNARDYIDFNKYVGDFTETRARLNTLRQQGKNQGIYDPYTEKINKQQLKEIRDNTGYSPLRQLQNIYKKKDIVEMLNSISQTTPQSNIPIAKMGGALPKYKLGSAINNNWLDKL